MTVDIATQRALAIPPLDTATNAAAIQRQAEADVPVVKAMVVDTAEDYALADAALTDVVTRKDAVQAMLKSATAPLNAGLKVVRSWFAPAVDALETCEAHLKGQLSTYRVRQAAEAQKAREAAALAVESGASADAQLAALQTAADAGAAPQGRSTVAFAWAVDRVVAPDMVPDEWWRVDDAKLAAFAKAHKGEDAPVVPGVLFKRIARVGARR